MPVESVTLASINSISNTSEKIKGFKEIVDQVTGVKKKAKPDVNGALTVIKFVVNTIGEHEMGVSKPVLAYCVEQLNEIDEDYNNELTTITNKSVDVIRAKYTYFADSLVGIVRLQSDLFQAEEQWRDAGRALASVDTEDQYISKAMTIAKRTEWRIQTAKFFLMNDDNTSATTHIQKSRKLLRDVPLQLADRDRLVLQHKTCYSQILDSERKFLLASVNYMELAQINSPLVKEEDLLLSLANAVTCAILAPAGGNRTRVLAMLYRDERCKNLQNFKILEKMHLNMLVPKREQDLFASTLSDHHHATLASGLTVFQRALYEHNMLAASQIYKNIQIAQLSKLLGVSDMQAEDLARGMIQEGRMNATIDQVSETIEFKDKQGSILLAWDDRIQDLCMAINDIIDQIDVEYPNTFEIP